MGYGICNRLGWRFLLHLVPLGRQFFSPPPANWTLTACSSFYAPQLELRTSRRQGLLVARDGDIVPIVLNIGDAVEWRSGLKISSFVSAPFPVWCLWGTRPCCVDGKPGSKHICAISCPWLQSTTPTPAGLPPRVLAVRAV